MVMDFGKKENKKCSWYHRSRGPFASALPPPSAIWWDFLPYPQAVMHTCPHWPVFNFICNAIVLVNLWIT